MLHPALPSTPGHDHWRRDFTGSTSVFPIVFHPSISPGQVEAFVDHLSLFRIGMSWGGTTSLVLALPDIERPGKDYGGRLVRLNIGLEEVGDLTADLAQAIATMAEPLTSTMLQ